MPHATVTLADLKVGMAQRWDGTPFWTEEEARLAINEALRFWNLLVGRWHTRVIQSIVGGQLAYPLPAGLTFAARVKIAGVGGLIVTSTPELDFGRPQWRSETTTTGGDVPTTPIHWAPQGLQTIVLWPTPAGAIVNGLIVDGVANTPILTADGQFVDLGEELHDPILDFALHVAAFKEGGPRWAATHEFYTTFLKLAAEENKLLKASRAYRTFAGLDRRRDLTPTRPGETRIDGFASQIPPLGGGR
jgi:hypothetical protein